MQNFKPNPKTKFQVYQAKSKSYKKITVSLIKTNNNHHRKSWIRQHYYMKQLLTLVGKCLHQKTNKIFHEHQCAPMKKTYLRSTKKKLLPYLCKSVLCKDFLLKARERHNQILHVTFVFNFGPGLANKTSKQHQHPEHKIFLITTDSPKSTSVNPVLCGILELSS